MPHIDIVSLVGSAVPATLRADGHLACWYVLVDGVPKSGPYLSREAAVASQFIWNLATGQRLEHAVFTA